MLRRFPLYRVAAVILLSAPLWILCGLFANAAGEEATAETSNMILFVRDTSRICVVDIDSGEVREVTTGTSPCWSPDRTRFAHVTNGSTIVIRSPEGEEQVAYATGLDRVSKLRWSPDGGQFAFIGRTTYWDTNVYVLDLESGEVAAFATPHAVASRIYAELAWSPDSDQLVYGFQGMLEMFIASLATGSEDAIEFQEIAIVTYVDWSPDGEWLAFSHNNSRICRVRLDGTEMSNITTTTLDVPEGEPSYQDLSLSWSPSGEHIVFSRARKPAEGGIVYDGLWVVDANGGDPIRLTDGNDTQPDWGYAATVEL